MTDPSYCDISLEIDQLNEKLTKYRSWELESAKNRSRKNRARILLVRKDAPNVISQLDILTRRLANAPKRDMSAIDADIEIIKSKIIAITGNYPVMYDGRNSWHDLQDAESVKYRELDKQITVLFREREHATH